VASVEQQIAQLESQLGTAGTTADVTQQRQQLTQQKTEAGTLRRSSSQALTSCSIYDNQTIRSGRAAMASMMAAQMAADCKKQTEAVSASDSNSNSAVESITANDFALNCATPGAAANPLCQQWCSKPGAENDPVCKALLSQMNGNGANAGGVLAAADSTASKGGDGGFDIGDADEDAQLPQENKNTGDEKGSGLATTTPGGGTGLNGSLPTQAGGDSGASSSGAPGAAGLDNKLIRGFSSGTGYARRSGGLRSGGGGFGGYGGYGARSPASTGRSPFKLTDFLPGGKHAPKRHLTGYGATGTAQPTVGPASANIFQMISNRYYLLCKNDVIEDCEALKKRGCPINVLGGTACPRP
jgi:hypothetical protein